MKIKVVRLDGLPDIIQEGVKEVTLEFVRMNPDGPVVDVGIDLGYGLTHFRVYQVSLALEETDGLDIQGEKVKGGELNKS